jgi:hypothetical protein
MSPCDLFTSKSTYKSLFLQMLLVCGLAMLLISLCAFFLLSPTRVAAQHGCAPDTPPPVSGGSIPAPPTPGSVLINEALSNPASVWNCSKPQGTSLQTQDSWIELYNTQKQTLDLYASHAMISLDNGSNWYHLPFGSVIAAGGFFIAFPEEQQANFSLTWTVTLFIGGTYVDQAAIPQLQPDQSYARVPDGSTTWQFADQPTVNASNNPPPPTPTKAPAETPTPTPKATPRTSGSTGHAGTNTPTSNGTQPAWNGVKLPPGETPSPAIPTALSTSPSSQTPAASPASQNKGADGGQIALITSLLLVLAGALTWCWRLFRAP